MQQFDAGSSQLIQSPASPAKWYYCICISTCEMFGREAAQGTASMEWRTLSMRSTPSAQSSRRWNVVDTSLSDSSIVSYIAVMVARSPTSCGHSSSPPPRVASSTSVSSSVRAFFLPNTASQRSSARKIWLRPRFLWSSWWRLGQPWGKCDGRVMGWWAGMEEENDKALSYDSGWLCQKHFWNVQKI